MSDSAVKRAKMLSSQVFFLFSDKLKSMANSSSPPIMLCLVFCSPRSGWTGKKGKQRVSRLLANANAAVAGAHLNIIYYYYSFFF